jgi:hypothetical protein
MTLFAEYNGGANGGNGHRKEPNPSAPGVIVDHVKDKNNDGTTDIEDVKLFLKKNKANRIAPKGNDQYPGGDFRRVDEEGRIVAKPSQLTPERRWRY